MKQLMLFSMFILVTSCALFSVPKRDPASIKPKTYNGVRLYQDNKEILDAIFPDFARVHYDIIDKKGVYIGKVEFFRDTKLSVKALLSKPVHFLGTKKNAWSGETFNISTIDYLNRGKYYEALMLTANRQMLLKVKDNKDLDLHMHFVGEVFSPYKLTNKKIYPLHD